MLSVAIKPNKQSVVLVHANKQHSHEHYARYHK